MISCLVTVRSYNKPPWRYYDFDLVAGPIPTHSHITTLWAQPVHINDCIYNGFDENWHLFPVFRKPVPWQTIGLLNNHGIHIMTTAKKEHKIGLVTTPRKRIFGRIFRESLSIPFLNWQPPFPSLFFHMQNTGIALVVGPVKISK